MKQNIKSQSNLSLPKRQYLGDFETRNYIPITSQNLVKKTISSYRTNILYSCRNHYQQDQFNIWHKDLKKKHKLKELLFDKLPKLFLRDAMKEIRKFALRKEVILECKFDPFNSRYERS